jgi:virulence-associated protein VapD
MSFIFIIIPIPCKTSSHISYQGGLIPLKAKISNADNVVKRYVNLEKYKFSWYNHNVKNVWDLNLNQNNNFGSTLY